MHKRYLKVKQKMETEQIERSEQIEVVYKKAKLSSRMFAHFIDISLFILTTLILFSITNMIVTRSGWYKNKNVQLVQLRNDSGLYVDNVVITTYVKTYDTDTKKKDFLSKQIENFYNNPTYITNIESTIKSYNERRKNATYGEAATHLFLPDGDSYIENTAVDVKAFVTFYSDEITNTTLGYLYNTPAYFYLTKFSFWCSVVQVIILGTISFTLYYLVLPLTCYKRGRQTIGMKLSKIALISVWADNITAGKYTLRFLFMFFVFIPLNFVSFLIPTFLSISMMFLTKTNSSLANYVFNDYMVDVKDQKVYFDALERSESEIKLQSMSIENRDLRLK